MIQLKRNKNLSVEAVARTHHLISDVPSSKGGDDLGMDPHELLESSLAACTALTLELYAKMKGIALQDVRVEVKIIKEGPETEILRKIDLLGEFTPEQKTRMLEIADRCPLHKLLESKITIKTEAGKIA